MIFSCFLTILRYVPVNFRCCNAVILCYFPAGLRQKLREMDIVEFDSGFGIAVRDWRLLYVALLTAPRAIELSQQMLQVAGFEWVTAPCDRFKPL